MLFQSRTSLDTQIFHAPRFRRTINFAAGLILSKSEALAYPIQFKLSQVTAYRSVVAPSRTSRPIDYYGRSCGALLAAVHEAASGPCATGIWNSRRSTPRSARSRCVRTLDVVKNEHLFVSVRQLVDDPFQTNAVNYATQAEVRSAHLHKAVWSSLRRPRQSHQAISRDASSCEFA